MDRWRKTNGWKIDVHLDAWMWLSMSRQHVAEVTVGSELQESDADPGSPIHYLYNLSWVGLEGYKNNNHKINESTLYANFNVNYFYYFLRTLSALSLSSAEQRVSLMDRLSEGGAGSTPDYR